MNWSLRRFAEIAMAAATHDSERLREVIDRKGAAISNNPLRSRNPFDKPSTACAGGRTRARTWDRDRNTPELRKRMTR